jgi:hypothetical protein
LKVLRMQSFFQGKPTSFLIPGAWRDCPRPFRGFAARRGGWSGACRANSIITREERNIKLKKICRRHKVFGNHADKRVRCPLAGRFWSVVFAEAFRASPRIAAPLRLAGIRPRPAESRAPGPA